MTQPEDQQPAPAPRRPTTPPASAKRPEASEQNPQRAVRPAKPSSAPNRSAKPARPAAGASKQSESAAPSRERSRSSAPFVERTDAAAAEAVDEDDLVIVPAMPIEYRGPSAPHAKRPSYLKSLRFRQTIIPVLLTMGVLVAAFGALHYLVSRDAPLAVLPGWLALLLIASGLFLLGLGVMNMLQVRGELAAAQPPAQ